LVAELGRAIKAGILAGLVYGIFYAFSVLLLFPVVASLLGIYTYSPPAGIIGSWTYVQLRVNPLAAIIIGPIYGLIIGVIYAFTYSRLPGRKIGRWSISQTKGVVLAIIVWLVMLLIAIPTRLPTSAFFSEIEGAPLLQITMTAWALFLFITLGVQLGAFWDRFKPKTPQPTVSEAPI